MGYGSEVKEGTPMKSCEGMRSVLGGPLTDVYPQVVAESNNIWLLYSL